MCSVCHQSPCDARCPNAPLPKAMSTCPCCNEGIMLDEEYATIDGVEYHVDCLEEMTTRELLKMFDVDTFTVGMEDLYD